MLESSSPFEPRKEQAEVQQLRDRVRDSGRALETVLHLSTVCGEAQSADEFLGQCMKALCDRLNAVLCVAWMYHAVDSKIEYRMHVDMQKIETAELIDALKARRLDIGESLVGESFEQSIPLSEEIDADDLDGKLANKAGLRNTFVMPLRNKYRVVGALQFFCRRQEASTKTSPEILNALGKLIGIQLDHKESDNELKQLHQQQESLQGQLRSAADQAIQSAKLKSEFVANVSHEIRTPLAGIMGMAEMLATNDKLDDESKDLANYILTSSHSLLAIVNDLLDFSKLEAGKLALYASWFSISDVIETIARSARASADKKGLKVRTHVDDRLPEKLLGDSARLTQVLMNFAHNAVKFTERGEITISADFESKTGNVVRVRFAVSDTGIGINPEAQRRLFEPFVQADGSTTRRFGGTGLGLSIARKLTQLMDGEIGLDSEDGVGSTFFVIVPLQFEEEELVG